MTIADKDGFIDSSGGVVIKPQFDHAWPFSCGLAMVEVDGKRGYIDKTGNLVVDPKFDMAIPFIEGFAFVSAGEKKGYIDTTGKMITEVEGGAESFSEGLAAVQLDGRWSYIDETGTLVIPAIRTTHLAFRKVWQLSVCLSTTASLTEQERW